MRILFIILFCWCAIYTSVTQPYRYKVPSYPNEYIEFDLFYGIFKIGEAHLEFTTDSTCKENAFIIAEAKSTGWIRFFKDIHYRYESCMDINTGLPVFDSRILIEGDYRDLNTVYYNHNLRQDSSVVYSAKTDSVVVPKNIYDLLTGFYDFRTNYIYRYMPDNYSFHRTTFFIDNVWELDISYHGIERVRINKKYYDCYIFKPKTIVGHFFKTSDALTIWVTRDYGNIPVKFCIEFKIGTLHGEITDYEIPKHEI